MSQKIEIGDSVMQDSIGGVPRIRFADGTSALLFEDYTCYCDASGYKSGSLSLDQQAHAAKQSGNFPQFLADTIDGRARQELAYDGYVADLNKSRYPDGRAPPKGQSVADAYQGYVDSLNAWRNP
jgi:hypothetical protein